MSIHRLYLPGPWPTPPASVTISGDEARHAVRVKRVREGEAAEVLSGDGALGRGVVGKIISSKRDDALRIDLTEVITQARTKPLLEVWSSVPKGGESGDMIDMLSQLGCDVWRPLVCERSIAAATEHKLDRLRRVCIESAKQCGRARFLQIGEAISFADAIGTLGGGVSASGPTIALICDGNGEPVSRVLSRVSGATRLVALVGPEGGWSPGELAMGKGAGLGAVRLAARVLRIETAAIAIAAVVGAAPRAGEN